MKFKSVLTLFIFMVSIIVSLSASEYIASLLLAKNDIKTICPNTDFNKFNSSRLFSYANAFYEPMSAVEHCQPEYDYTYHINHLGFRDNKLKREDLTILAVGDSFTFGFGVKDEETFPALIGANNAGMWAMSFDTQSKSFQRNVKLVDPDIVVWSIYPPHIITIMPTNWSNPTPGDKILFTAESSLSRKLLAIFPFQKIREYSLTKLLYKATNLSNVFFDGADLVLHRDAYQTKEVILFDRNISETKYTDNEKANKDFGSNRDNILLQMQGYFKEAKRVAESKGIKIVFVIIPSKLNLHLHKGTANLGSYPNMSIDPELPALLVSDVIENAGFSSRDILNLGSLPELQADDWKQYYFTIDAHLNVEGNKLVAKAIKDKLGL